MRARFLTTGFVLTLVLVATWQLICREPVMATGQQAPLTPPSGAICAADDPDEAHELIELPGLPGNMVVLSAPAGGLPAADWPDYRPSLPWARNSTRNLLFQESCYWSSPGAPDCAGEDCFRFREIDGWRWLELARIADLGCLPDTAGCLLMLLRSGYLSLTVIEKCHAITFHGTARILEDGRGNRYVMHATADNPPGLENPALPPGWSLETQTLVEPLEVLPRGPLCLHNILRDNLNQSYHQFGFAPQP